jgi:hypothetical protein
MATSTSGQLTHKRRPVKSCGCLTIERTKEVHTQHGDCIDARNNGVSSEYQAWDNMIARCERLSCREYCHYGGRGIMVCSQWKQSFTNFLADMGRKPTSKHSLDRINNDGNYEPLNCRWATAKQQINNRRLKKIEDFSNEIIRQEFIKRGLSI